VTGALRVVLATKNPGKVREFGRLLGPSLAVEALPTTVIMPEETGLDFAANARLKAESVATALGRGVAVLADDSGLEVATLGGRPGVLSARYAGTSASDHDNVTKLMDELGGTQDRQARFVCCLCLELPDDLAAQAGARRIEVEGVLSGQIALSPRGDDGFGYDPVFVPAGWAVTLAEADPADKDSVSHRGAATRALLGRLSDRSLLSGERS
jgi:non-canonical purine NTP pyrophosphatase (RdgB/HAM1 family)